MSTPPDERFYVFFSQRILLNIMYIILFTELSHVVQERAEGPKAPSPGHRPGYSSNQYGAL